MTILFINRWVGYNEGGNETHIKDLIYQFASRGHSVSVITTRGDKLTFVKELVDVQFVNAPKGYYSYSFLGPIYALWFNLQCFGILTKMLILEKKRFDLLSVHFSVEAFLARFIKLIFGIPYIMVMAGDHYLELIEGKRADGVIQISNFMNAQCQKMGYTADVLPKGFDLTRFRPGLPVDDLRAQLGVTGKKVVLTVCRLDPRKNLETLIRAANELINKKMFRDIVFIIVGDGVERVFLEQLVQNYKLQAYIKFIGSLPNTGSELPLYYNLADLFVLPTTHEGFGWVYLEAMACGLPILTTNVSSNPEVVGGVGTLIEPKNPKLLASRMFSLLQNSAQLEEMRIKGLDKAASYSWSALMPKYESYYEQTSLKKAAKLRLRTLLFLMMDSVKIALCLVHLR